MSIFGSLVIFVWYLFLIVIYSWDYNANIVSGPQLEAQPPLSPFPPPPMKLHFVQGSIMENRNFESRSALPQSPLPPPHFENSSYAPGYLWFHITWWIDSPLHHRSSQRCSITTKLTSWTCTVGLSLVFVLFCFVLFRFVLFLFLFLFFVLFCFVLFLFCFLSLFTLTGEVVKYTQNYIYTSKNKQSQSSYL